MALPITSAPLPPDIAIHGWAAITVRVAWTLVQTGVRVTKEVLIDARDHVLFHLEPNLDLAAAEDMAEYLTREFINRARHQKETERWPQDARMPISPRWHKTLAHGLPPLESAVLKQHYGNGITLQKLEQSLQVDAIGLEASRGAIREVLRKLASDDGMPIETWPNERLDRLISRIAAFSEYPSPPLDEVADGCHQDLIRTCPRCERTWRLAQNGIINSEDLVAPGVIARPEHQVRLLVLHFHPDAKQHRVVIANELKTPWFPLGDDLLLIDLKDEEQVIHIVLLAAELGTPSREHLRGAILEGLGRWSPHGLLGPLPSESFQLVRSLNWGHVGPIGQLPAVIPEPPSSQKWWVMASITTLVAMLLCWIAFGPEMETPSTYPLETEFEAGQGFHWLQFDVDEAAIVTLISEQNNKLHLLSIEQNPAAKAIYAVGDGSFRLRAPGQAVLIVSSESPILELTEHIEMAGQQNQPLASLAARIKSFSPQSDIRMFNP